MYIAYSWRIGVEGCSKVSQAATLRVFMVMLYMLYADQLLIA